MDEDYDQIHPDDLEEMDIQWQLAMNSRRAKWIELEENLLEVMLGLISLRWSALTVMGLIILLENVKRMNPNSTPVRQNYSYQGSSSQSARNNVSSKALVVTQQDESYDWSTHVEEPWHETQTFMAKITK